MRHPLHSTSPTSPQPPTSGVVNHPPRASCHICEPDRCCPWHQVEVEVVEAGMDWIKRDGGASWTAAKEIEYRRTVADICFGSRHDDDPKKPILRGLYKYADLLAAMDDPPWDPADLLGMADWLERASIENIDQAEDTLHRAIEAYEGAQR